MTRLFIFLFLFPAIVHAQYWQQKVDTRISITLNDEQHFLHGYISMDYVNNSPDTLSFIYFHLYPNAYQNDRTAYEKQAVENGNTAPYFSKEEDRGYLDSMNFLVDGQEAVLMATEDMDIGKLILSKPLIPGTSVTIATPFRVKIPLTFSRLGHKGQAYQISQWFPKPAVYDKKGWHEMPYLDQGEFYSEYGSYDVSITLPKNYIVMATGNLENAEEQKWLDSLAELPLPADTLFANFTPSSDREMKTLRYHEDNIHDFAWFADKRWIVRKQVITLNPERKVAAYSCFFPEHQSGWKNSLQDIKTTITGYGAEVGDYPYKTVKVTEGALSAGGGMEYPTVTVIAASNNKDFVNTVIIHEVGHNWFYGALGSNERDFPWMDEGINSFYENKFADKSKTEQFLTQDKGLNYLVYAMLSANHNLMPADTASAWFTNMNYGIDVYAKVPYFLAWLESYIGPDTFKTAMQDYFQTWKFRHPQPEDFELILKKHTSKNIDWFFKALKETKGVDFAVRSVKNKQGHTEVTLKNKTGFEGPVKLNFITRGEGDVRLNGADWAEPFTGKKTFVFPPAYWDEVSIDEVIPDYNISNNSDKTKLGLGFLGGVNLSEKKKMWIAPAIGYNYYDGFMAGLLFHNLTIPENKFQFALAPMFGFKSKRIAGTGVVGYTSYYDEDLLHDIQWAVESKSFDFAKSDLNVPHTLFNRYLKIAPEVILNFRKPFPRSTVERSLSLKAYFIREDYLNYNRDTQDSLYHAANGGFNDHFYGKINYKHRNNSTFNPFDYSFEGQIGESFAKISAEAHFKIDYSLKNKALYIRAYAGKFFDFSDMPSFAHYRYQLATTYTGENDYLYDETYISRSEQGVAAWQNQLSEKEGGFKMSTLQYTNPVGLSDDWLLALNLKTDIPYLPLPIRVFGDIAAFSEAQTGGFHSSRVVYAAGLELYLDEYFSIYFPLLLSTDFNDYSKSVLGKGRFGKMISFSLNLGDLNWLKLPAKFIKM